MCQLLRIQSFRLSSFFVFLQSVDPCSMNWSCRLLVISRVPCMYGITKTRCCQQRSTFSRTECDLTRGSALDTYPQVNAFRDDLFLYHVISLSSSELCRSHRICLLCLLPISRMLFNEEIFVEPISNESSLAILRRAKIYFVIGQMLDNSFE